MRLLLPTLAAGACLAFATTASAQQIPVNKPLPARPVTKPVGMVFHQPHGLVYWNTNIGSFKLLGNDSNSAEGILDFEFKGTVLISDLAPGSSVTITGTVRKEIDDAKTDKVVYFGKGRMTIYGKFRAVQFFGTDLRARFDGFGIVRASGEFDKNLDTGNYWYDGDKDQFYLSSSMTTIPVPKYRAKKPTVKIEGGGK